MNASLKFCFWPLKRIKPAFPLFILVTFGLVACSSLTRAEQPAHNGWIELNSKNSIGQTLISRYAGLTGITIFLNPRPESGSAILRLSLYQDTDQQDLVASSEILLHPDQRSGFYNFSFNKLMDSSRQAYQLALALEGDGQVLIGKSSGDTYLNGALTLDGQFQEAQLAFKLSYDPMDVLLGIIAEFGTWGYRLLAAIILFILPGWGILSLLFPKWKSFDWLEKITLSTGLSLAIYPLLFLWTDAAGLRLGPLYAWIPPVLGTGLTIMKSDIRKFISKGEIHHLRVRISLASILTQSRSAITDVTILLLIGLISFTRLWAIRMLPIPLWGDSYHHTLITQLLIDHKGLFHSWEPYAELQSFTYHFGFHSFAAVFHWFTGIDSPQAVLWTGQILNILSVLTLYILSKRITRNRWGGILTILISGLLLSMPMYYLNWGRYTQLAGHALLIPAAIFLWIFLDNREVNWKYLFVVSILQAGLFLTHYRVLIFLLPFYLIHTFLHFRKIDLKKQWLFVLVQGWLALLLVLPWLLRLYQGKLPFQFIEHVSTPASQVTSATLEYNIIGDLKLYLPIWMWWLTGAAIGSFILRKNKPALIVTLWWIVIFLMANPATLGLPGTGILSNFAVLISTYIPASVLVGSSIGDLFNSRDQEFAPDDVRTSLRSRFLLHPSVTVFLAISFIIVGIVGARFRLREIRPFQHSLVTYPDLSASEWIRNNLPHETKFLVNAFFAYSGSLIVGSDAGWWLPLLSGRRTMLPPMPYVSEKGPSPDYVTKTNQLVKLINAKGVNNQEVKETLKDKQITHIYIGQQQGRVNAPVPPYLDVDKLIKDPDFELLYHKNLVWIFKILH